MIYLLTKELFLPECSQANPCHHLDCWLLCSLAKSGPDESESTLWGRKMFCCLIYLNLKCLCYPIYLIVIDHIYLLTGHRETCFTNWLLSCRKWDPFLKRTWSPLSWRRKNCWRNIGRRSCLLLLKRRFVSVPLHICIFSGMCIVLA